MNIISTIKEKKIISRFLLYISISVFYYFFMSVNSPLGIEWRPFHQERVLNATENLLSFNFLNRYALTTETNPEAVRIGLTSEEPFVLYVQAAHSYIHFAITKLLLGKDYLITLGESLDRITISLTAMITAEIARISILNTKLISRNLIAISTFTLFLTSPWTYRMVIAAWLEIYFIFFFLLAQLCFLYKRKTIGILFILISSLAHFQWAFILFVLYITLILIDYFSQNPVKLSALFPPGINSFKTKFFFLLSLTSPIFMTLIISILFKINNTQIELTNSSALSRIGLTFPNIHHGGWLAGFQFLGGNRISLCLPSQLTLLNTLDSKIFLFNCSLSIVGMFILSILSIFGYLYFHINNTKLRFITLPIAFSLFTFAIIFQQSFASHLQGYSYLFSFIFSIGAVSAILFALTKWGPKYYSVLIYSPIVLGIIISNIRVSFLTGING